MSSLAMGSNRGLASKPVEIEINYHDTHFTFPTSFHNSPLDI